MTITVVALLKRVKDAEKMAAYRDVADAALAKHGGRLASVTREPERLEGEMETPEGLVLLSFPSVEAAQAWRADPELAEAHALRRAGGDFSIFIGGAGA